MYINDLPQYEVAGKKNMSKTVIETSTHWIGWEDRLESLWNRFFLKKMEWKCSRTNILARKLVTYWKSARTSAPHSPVRPLVLSPTFPDGPPLCESTKPAPGQFHSIGSADRSPAQLQKQSGKWVPLPGTGECNAKKSRQWGSLEIEAGVSQAQAVFYQLLFHSF